MVYRWFFQHWLRNVAQQKVRQTVAEAARERLAEAEAAGRPRPCHVGVVFALGEESGGLEDLLSGVVTTKGDGFVVRQGELRHRRVVLVVSGAGGQRAAKATEALIAGHQPGWVIAAGFCGGLSPKLARHDFLLADALVDTLGHRLEVSLEKVSEEIRARRGVHTGPLLQVDQVVRLPDEKTALSEKHGAWAADLESLAVAEVCLSRNVPFLAIRVVSDAVDDRLPPELSYLLRQKTRTARLGAALGAILNRPGSFKDLVRLRQNALAASDRLARLLSAVVRHLVPLPPVPT
jgi:adenosylhomocysteine nucleosidase